jgi:metallophosphoesterase (TIGR00282 family)
VPDSTAKPTENRPHGPMTDAGSENPRILFVGDVVGSLGRRTLLSLLPELTRQHNITFTVVNGENSAGGLGITPKIAREFFAAGVDVITLGNHTYHQREIVPYLDEEPRILRPVNFLKSQPGHGFTVVERHGIRLGVLNISTNLFMDLSLPMFAEADAALHQLKQRTDHILVDVHGEATSEKVGLGWYLDGRVTAVVGTHTHVPTNDYRVLNGGTAYITDVGMTGPRGGVIGVVKEMAIRSMQSRMPTRFETSDVDPWLNGVVIEASPEPHRAVAITPVLEPAPAPAPAQSR